MKIIIVYCIIGYCIAFTSGYLIKTYISGDFYIENIGIVISLIIIGLLMNRAINGEKKEAVEKYKEENE